MSGFVFHNSFARDLHLAENKVILLGAICPGMACENGLHDIVAVLMHQVWLGVSEA